ncbi:MAG: aminotransferase class V-fold PLP-dependent enzyme [Eubacteriales bacterium]|jgi:cysteine desulfurase family protein
MQSINLDQASTSFPKAPGVVRAMTDYLIHNGCNIGRGGYSPAYEAGSRVLEVRAALAGLLGCPKPQQVVFTPGATFSLNLVLKGLLRPGDHALVSSVEHNAVMRPLTQLARQGVQWDRVPCDEQGRLEADRVEAMLRPNTRLVLLTHASNVCGTILPVAQVGHLCRQRGIFCVVDAAQTAGILPISLEEMELDGVAFPGHKGLLGPQGIGGLALSEPLAQALEPLVSGGTGSLSDQEEVPPFLPDRLEPGTLNLPGILGLGAAVEYLMSLPEDSVRRREEELTGRLLRGIASLPGLRLAGLPGVQGRVGVVSVEFLEMDNAQAAWRLEQEFGILTRVGMHCAPSAHRTLKTYPQGTVRLSVGHQTTHEEIDRAVEALTQLTKGV